MNELHPQEQALEQIEAETAGGLKGPAQMQLRPPRGH